MRLRRALRIAFKAMPRLREWSLKAAPFPYKIQPSYVAFQPQFCPNCHKTFTCKQGGLWYSLR